MSEADGPLARMLAGAEDRLKVAGSPDTPESIAMLARVRLERDELDGGWTAECLDFPGVISEGETAAEAFRNVTDARREAEGVG